MSKTKANDQSFWAKMRSGNSPLKYFLDSLQIKANEAEESFMRSSYHPDSQILPWNPDDLVQLDYTYGIYEDMLNDDQVEVSMSLKKDLVVGSGWSIVWEDEDEKTFLEEILTHEVDRPFSEILYDILQGFEYGFSLSEKIFKTMKDGKLALKDIKPRHPSTWLIHQDDHGNVTRYEQRGKNSDALDIDPTKLMHYINNDRHQNPYGRSDLRTAYNAWVAKKHVFRYHLIFLETAAQPKPIGKYDRSAPQEVVDDMIAALKKLQTKSAFAMPKEFELEWLEVGSQGDSFVKAINLFNMFIGRALFIPDLVGLTGSETGGGSFSLGTEQIGIFYKHIKRRREIIENLINKHIIRPLYVWNFGLSDSYPEFKFNNLSEDDAKKDAELWIKGIQGVGYQPTIEEINTFRRAIGYPESDELEMKKQAPIIGPFDQMKDDEEPEEEEGEELEVEGDDGEEEDKEEEKKEFSLAYSPNDLPGNYHKKVNFKLADNVLKTALDKILAESGPLVEEVFEDLYDQLQKKKIIQTQKLERADTIKLKNLKKLQQLLKKHFRLLYNDGNKIAQTEVRKTDFAVENVAADAFLEFLEKETFNFVGKWSFTVLEKTKNELTRAIKDGMPLSSVISVLDNEGKALSETALERYARTKTTEVFNRGRLEYFNETGVVEAYQYSAILDGRTSNICRALDGKIFEKDKAPVPPLHFNCRSLLVPITRFEEYTADTKTNDGKSLTSFLEKEVSDKGFSVFHMEHSEKCCEWDEEEKEKIEIVWPEITDPGVDFVSNYEVDENGVIKKEVACYSKDSKPFCEIHLTYDSTGQKIIKKETKYLDERNLQSVNR